jgi:hypothetical protein
MIADPTEWMDVIDWIYGRAGYSAIRPEIRKYHEKFITESTTTSANAYPLITNGGYLYGFQALNWPHLSR